MLISPGEDSSYTLVINPPGIDRIFIHCPGANDTFGAADIPIDEVRQARSSTSAIHPSCIACTATMASNWRS